MSWIKNIFKRKEKSVKRDYVDLFEKVAKDNNKDLIWLLLGSLISSDNLISEEACKTSIMMLNEIKDTVPKLKDKDYSKEEKDKIIELCDSGLEICKQDLETFTNGKE